jgi:hypothetical protein
LLALFLGACGSSSPGGNGMTPTTCTDVASALCTKAGQCANNGKAPVTLTPASGAIDYASVAYCQMTLAQQCGPQAPASDVPLIRDPAMCGAAVSGAQCSQQALLLPTACGGTP